jgi:hypothetical protein
VPKPKQEGLEELDGTARRERNGDGHVNISSATWGNDLQLLSKGACAEDAGGLARGSGASFAHAVHLAHGSA